MSPRRRSMNGQNCPGQQYMAGDPELIIKWDLKYKHMDNFSRMCMHEVVGSKFEPLCSREHAK